LSVGAVLVYLRFTGTPLNDRLLKNYHLLDALDDFLLVLGLALMLLALFALFPQAAWH
jgi:hypothetical protein